MRFKHLCQILSLIFVCVVSADQDVSATETDDVGINTETQNITDDVFYQPAECTSDADCRHLGKCETKEGVKLCNCKEGTSGDFCEKVDECVDNPVKCGTLKDVSCVFDVVQEKAVCKCDNDTKTYVVDEERCMSPCTRYGQCGHYGHCIHEVGYLKFCSCDLGTSGDYCEIIDECHNKQVDCGLEPNATCTLGVNGNAYCECSDLKKGFDYDDKVCKDCAWCGKKNAYYFGCEYKNGTRSCFCQSMSYYNDKGICEDCKCGPGSFGCNFVNGTKICQCYEGYEPNGDVCERCDCGYDESNCEFKDGEKVCTCKEGYIKAGKNGICTQMCNATNPCENGGKCVRSVCSCLKGTSGHLCKTIDDCDGRGKCGDENCLYNVTSQESYCKCRDTELTFDDVNKWCSVCFCRGYSSTYGCRFDGWDMVCKCLKGYAQLGDECKECDCGDHGNCSLYYWGKICSCDKGYVEKRGKCIVIDECRLSYRCPNTTDCVNTPGSYNCVCKDGYERKNELSNYDIKVHGCKDIDECVREWSPCNDNYARCVNTEGSYRCDCQAGYHVSKGYTEKYNLCQQDSRPWRTATIVIGCLSAVTIIVLLIGICNRHM